MHLLRHAAPLAALLLAGCAFGLDFDAIDFGRDASAPDTSAGDTDLDAAEDGDAPPSTDADPEDAPDDVEADGDGGADDDVVPDALPDVPPDTGPDVPAVCVPSQEVCDGRDNDCDGLIDDEDPDVQLGPDDCGRCGVVCGPVAGGDSTCVADTCVVNACDDDRLDLNRDASDGCEYALGQEAWFVDMNEALAIEFLSPSAVEVAGPYGVTRYDEQGRRVASLRWSEANATVATWADGGFWTVHDALVVRSVYDEATAQWQVERVAETDAFRESAPTSIAAVGPSLVATQRSGGVVVLPDVLSGSGEVRTYGPEVLGEEDPVFRAVAGNEEFVALLAARTLWLARVDGGGEAEVVSTLRAEEVSVDTFHDMDRVDPDALSFVLAARGGVAFGGSLVLATRRDEGFEVDVRGANDAFTSARWDRESSTVVATLTTNRFGRIGVSEGRWTDGSFEQSGPEEGRVVAVGSEHVCLVGRDVWGCRLDILTQFFVNEFRAWTAGAASAVGASRFLAATGRNELYAMEATATGLRLVQRLLTPGQTSRLATTTDGRGFAVFTDRRVLRLVRISGMWRADGFLQLDAGIRENIRDVVISQGYVAFAAGVSGVVAYEMPATALPDGTRPIRLLPPTGGIAVESVTAVAAPGSPGDVIIVGTGGGRAWAWQLEEASRPVEIAFPVDEDTRVPLERVAAVASTRPGRFAVLDLDSTLGLASFDFAIVDDEIELVGRPFLQGAAQTPGGTGSDVGTRLVARNNFIVRSSPTLGAFVLFDNGIDSLISTLPETDAGDLGRIESPCTVQDATLLDDSRLVLSTSCGFHHFHLLTPP